MPETTIVMPVYMTDPMYLLASIRSLEIALPSDSAIHIGIDGEYTEEGYKHLEYFKKRLSSSRLKVSYFSRQGLVRTLNSLIACTDSKYIARHDSDDICLPNRLKSQLEALENNRRSAFCGTQITRCNHNMQPYRFQRKYPSSFAAQLFYSILFNNPIAHPSLMIKREVFDNICYRNISGAEDWDLYIRLWERGFRSFNLCSSGILYRVHANQITSNKRDFKLLESLKMRSINAAMLHYPLFRSLEPFKSILCSSHIASIGVYLSRLLQV